MMSGSSFATFGRVEVARGVFSSSLPSSTKANFLLLEADMVRNALVSPSGNVV